MSGAKATGHQAKGRGRTGFALVELLAVGAIGMILATLLVIGASDSRRNARLGQDLASLRYYGTSTVAYAADNADLMWGFSWEVGVTPGADPDLATAGSTLDAAAHQAIQILRDRGGRTELTPPASWIAHVLFSHLVVADYNGSALPDHAAVSMGDTNRVCGATIPRDSTPVCTCRGQMEPPRSPTTRNGGPIRHHGGSGQLSSIAPPCRQRG